MAFFTNTKHSAWLKKVSTLVRMIWSCCSWSRVKTRFSNILWLKNEVSDYLTDYLIPSKNFLPQWHIPRCQGCSGRSKRNFHTWINHQRVQTLNPMRIFGTCGIRLRRVWLSHCDNANVYQNKATVNSLVKIFKDIIDVHIWCIFLLFWANSMDGSFCLISFMLSWNDFLWFIRHFKVMLFIS